MTTEQKLELTGLLFKLFFGLLILLLVLIVFGPWVLAVILEMHAGGIKLLREAWTTFTQTWK